MLPMIDGPVALATDMSKWGGDFTIEEVACAMDSGFSINFPASGPGGYGEMFQQQAKVTIQGGMELGTYTFLEWGSDPRWWAAKARQSVGSYFDQITYWGVDIEDSANTPPPTLGERITYVMSFIDQLEEYGVPHSNILIYTGGWYYVREDAFQNSPYFYNQGYGLWESYYDENKNRNGWFGCPWPVNKIYITQYGGTQYVCGQSVDVNAVYRLPNGDHSNTLEEDMSALEELNKLKMALFAGSERPGWTDQQRLEYANYVIDAGGQSIWDLVGSAISLAKGVADEPKGLNGNVNLDQLVEILKAAQDKAEEFAVSKP